MSATGDETGRRSHAAASVATWWLSLAASPTFAIMALVSWVPGEAADMMGSAAHSASALGGMTAMYVLMSAFHSAPWLKLIARRPSVTRGSSRKCLDHSL